jgi:hypothetical protein
MYKPKNNYGPNYKSFSNINEDVETLIKAKVTIRNGEQYYSDGPNAGKKVGTVRGMGTKAPTKSPTSKKATANVATPKTKDEAIKQASQIKKMLKDKKIGEPEARAFIKESIKLGMTTKELGQALKPKAVGGRPKIDKVNRWLDTMISEKDLDLDETVSVEGPSGYNRIPLSAVVEQIKAFDEDTKKIVQTKLIEIDFKNGDIKDFLKYIAKKMAL